MRIVSSAAAASSAPLRATAKSCPRSPSAFKPTATVLKPQKTVRPDGRATELSAKGRHAPGGLPRAAPIVEAMAALVAVDHWIRDRGQNAPFGRCGRKA